MMKSEADETQQAKLEIWEYAFGFTPMAVLKCAIQLKIADVIESQAGGAMTLSQLSAAVGCSPQILRRIMRYLIHRRFFKQTTAAEGAPAEIISYAQTPLSRLLLRNDKDSMAAIIELESSPAMITPWHRLGSRALENGEKPFEAEHGKDIWDYSSADPAQSKLFNEGMGCMARHSVAAIVGQYPDAFRGIGSLVDVGGGDGSALRAVMGAFPSIRGINFDLPHVVSAAPKSDDDAVIEHVGGNMFDAVPNADAAFLMRVLHDWGDEECIEILKKCRAAIPLERGKVIIAEAVMRKEEEDDDDDQCRHVSLALDMVMLVHTERGKERNAEEWEFLVREAGFTRFTLKHIQNSIVSLLEAYP